MPDMRHLINVTESVAAMPVPFLYHATRRSDLDSIMRVGLLTRYFGKIHGGMEIHPPKPALYLSRTISSNNLHAALFDGTPTIVLKIDAAHLDQQQLWPDDAIYSMFENGDVFAHASQIARAFDMPMTDAKILLNRLESASNAELPQLLQASWRWYLKWSHGGEVAYTADIPPALIVDVQEYR